MDNSIDSENKLKEENKYKSKNFILKSSFQNNNEEINEEYSKEDIIKNCINICKNQKGCRYLQQLIDENHKLANQKIYYIIKNKINEISLDSFGNYFIQKVIKYLNNYQLKEILKMIKDNFLEICMNQYGTRVIQKLIDKIQNDNELIDFFNNLFIKNFLELILNSNSTHIIIKYFSSINSHNDKFINLINNNIYIICTNKFSCCTLQKIIENLNDIQKKKCFNLNFKNL